MESKRIYTVKEASDTLGITRNSLHWYLRTGLIPHVRIDKSYHRILEQWQIDLLDVLLHMKQAGFKSKDLRRYSRLFREGRRTEAERLAMLTTKKHQLRNTIESCEKAVDYIERQEEIYQQRHNRQRRH